MDSERATDPAGLQARLRRLETAVDASGLGLWEWDIASGALTWNSRNRELFGVTHDEPLTIQDFTELVHADDREAVRAAYTGAAQPASDGAFTMEFRLATTPGGKTRWLQGRGRLLKDAGEAGLVVGVNLDITDRKVAEERRGLILGELAHRAKNALTVMMTIVAQTARHATDVKDFEALLMARLKAMADSQDLVTHSSGQPLPLNDLLDRALEPFDAARFDRDPGLAGVSVSVELVVAMALLLHELATNAVKYGALSAHGGRIGLTLAASEEGHTVLDWTESGGPPVTPPHRRGFGTRLLDISLRSAGGEVHPTFAPAGFQARIRFPTRHVRR